MNDTNDTNPIDATPDVVVDTVTTPDVVVTPKPARVPKPRAAKPRAAKPTVSAAFTFANVPGSTVPKNWPVPTVMVAIVNAFRIIHTLPVVTSDDRIACVNAFRAAMLRAMPNTPNVTGNTGRFTGRPIMAGQNDMFVCAAVANVPLASGHITCAWGAEFPGARAGRVGDVPYIAVPQYGFSARADYVAGRNRGGSGSIVPGGIGIVTEHGKRGYRPA